jgi:hypothetical protein
MKKQAHIKSKLTKLMRIKIRVSYLEAIEKCNNLIRW